MAEREEHIFTARTPGPELVAEMRALKERGVGSSRIAIYLNNQSIPTETGRGYWYARTVLYAMNPDPARQNAYKRDLRARRRTT